MIKLSIPFTKDNKILSLVKEEHLNYIDEIYIPVPHSIIESARPYGAEESEYHKDNIENHIALAKSKGLKVTLIANKQFIEHTKLRSTSIRLCKFLKEMKDKYDIDKVILSNLYIIGQYGDYIREMGIEIELSVLVGINSVEAFTQIVSTNSCITNVCLGDAFLHDVEAIAYLRKYYPDIKLKIIPNHGCLVNCASEQQHHNYSACTFAPDSDDPVSCSNNAELRIAVNTCATCRVYTEKNGRNLWDISFVRPEDSNLYDGLIDNFKISGREWPASEMIQIIEAYGKQEYNGSIETLLDMGVKSNVGLLNENFPREFGTRRSTCGHQCYKCNYCKITSDFVKSHFDEKIIE